MLRGWFGGASRRPYIEGRLILPRLNITRDVTFCVDTGADRSLLMPIDGVRMRLDYDKLTGKVESVGVGGMCVNYLEQALLVFREARRTAYVYRFELEIASPSAEIMDVPSLLGRDVLNRWRMAYDPTKGRLTFEVVTADEIVPIKSA